MTEVIFLVVEAKYTFFSVYTDVRVRSSSPSHECQLAGYVIPMYSSTTRLEQDHEHPLLQHDSTGNPGPLSRIECMQLVFVISWINFHLSLGSDPNTKPSQRHLLH
jgi:hypothetical protein